MAKVQQTSGQRKYTDPGHTFSTINNSVSSTTTSRVEERVRGFSVIFQINIYSDWGAGELKRNSLLIHSSALQATS